MTRRLPITVVPVDGEAWDSYLTRVAGANASNLRDLAERVGLLENRRWPAFHGVVIDDQTRARASAALDLDPTRIDAMHLSAYNRRAIDIDPLVDSRTAAAARASSRVAWVRFTGSRFCSACLADTGVWQLVWRLPWMTCCPTHRLVLAHRCLCCGQLARTGRGVATTRPVRGRQTIDTRVCGQALPHSYGHACNTDLTTTPARPVTQAERALADAFARTIDTGAGVAVGRLWPALDCLGAWQRAACYALALGCVRPVTGGWAPTHPWVSPPHSAEDVLALAIAARDLVDAPSIEAAAGVLGAWCEQAGTIPTPATFRDVAKSGTVTDPIIGALLARTGRSHSVLIRNLALLDGQERLRVTNFDIDDIPQLIWPCALPADLLTLGSPGPDLVRAVTALTLARIAGATSWAQAGQALGWTAAQGTQWSRYVFRGSHHSLRKRIIEAALTLAPLLASQPKRHRWAGRPARTGPTRVQLAAAQHADCRTSTTGAWCPCRIRTETTPRVAATA